MAFEKGRKFSTGTSVHRKRQMSTLVEKEGHFGPALTVRDNPALLLNSLPPSVPFALLTLGRPQDSLPRYLCGVLR